MTDIIPGCCERTNSSLLFHNLCVFPADLHANVTEATLRTQTKQRVSILTSVLTPMADVNIFVTTCLAVLSVVVNQVFKRYLKGKF
jgi:hypothetical protein